MTVIRERQIVGDLILHVGIILAHKKGSVSACSSFRFDAVVKILYAHGTRPNCTLEKNIRFL
jgi:hypothetical protein